MHAEAGEDFTFARSCGTMDSRGPWGYRGSGRATMPKSNTILGLIERYRVAMAKWLKENDRLEALKQASGIVPNGSHSDALCVTTCRALDTVEDTPCTTSEEFIAKFTFLVKEEAKEFTTADAVVDALRRDLKHLARINARGVVRKSARKGGEASCLNQHWCPVNL
jgi:hypothetical protein